MIDWPVYMVGLDEWWTSVHDRSEWVVDQYFLCTSMTGGSGYKVGQYG